MAEAVLSVKNLTFSYIGEPVLRETGLEVQRGDFVAILGSNGAGKSTLLRLILGELSLQQGEISLFGQPLQRFRQWPRIGYVPQSSAVVAAGFPASAAEVVGSNLYSKIGPFRRPGKEHRAQVAQALELVGMKDYANRRIGELSGGQLQRIMLARAMVAQPELLLLDEPSTGVDAQSAQALYEKLCEMHKQGITVIMVTHDLVRAAEYIQKAFCLEHGTIVELDSEQLAHELAHRHQHP